MYSVHSGSYGRAAPGTLTWRASLVRVKSHLSARSPVLHFERLGSFVGPLHVLDRFITDDGQIIVARSFIELFIPPGRYKLNVSVACIGERATNCAEMWRRPRVA